MKQEEKGNMGKKDKLMMAMTICTKCGYEAITWHKDLKKLERCRKCKGLLRMVYKENDKK